jgi:ATP synthase protein I
VKDDKRQHWRMMAMASTMGISMVLATVIGLAIGYWLDKAFDTSPWLLLIFLGLGIAAGFRNLYVIGKRSMKE